MLKVTNCLVKNDETKPANGYHFEGVLSIKFVVYMAVRSAIKLELL